MTVLQDVSVDLLVYVNVQHFGYIAEKAFQKGCGGMHATTIGILLKEAA